MYWIKYEKLNELLSQYPHFKDDITYVLKNSNYVTKEEIVERTKDLVIKWKSERDPSRKLYVLMDEQKKIGSRKWLYVECYDLLPPHEIIYPDQEINDDDSEIVIIDDWLITGVSLMESISNFRETNNWRCKSSFTFIITCCSDKYVDVIKSTFNIDDDLKDILCRGVELLGGFNKLGITVDDFPDIFHDLLYDLKDIPEINNEINNYFSRSKSIYYHVRLNVLEISHLNKEFIKEFMDPVENCYYIIHSEYKIPDSTLFRKLLITCRSTINRDFLIDVGRKYEKIINHSSISS